MKRSGNPGVLANHGSHGLHSTSLQRLEREAAIPPSLDAPQEGSHVLDAPTSQGERRPGAARLVGSAAVENDLPASRELELTLREVAGIQV